MTDAPYVSVYNGATWGGVQCSTFTGGLVPKRNQTAQPCSPKNQIYGIIPRKKWYTSFMYPPGLKLRIAASGPFLGDFALRNFCG